MENIKNKMPCKGPKTFFGFNILLSANMAIVTNDRCSTVQAVLFFAFWLMRHVKFFLKIGTKMLAAVLFETIRKAFSIFDKTIS